MMIHPMETGREVIEPLQWKRESLLHTLGPPSEQAV